MKTTEQEKIILKFADILGTINSANAELDRFVLKERVTAGRDFRRKFRVLRDLCKEIITVSQEYEKTIREDKKGLENEQ
jgi:hypothetical protein